VLVADERWQSRGLLAAWLAETGLDVREAADGEQAMAAWAEWRPHVALLAMGLPLVVGREVARRIKASPKGRATVVIGMVPDSLVGRRGIAVGFDDLITLPISRADLLGLIAGHLGLDLRVAEQPPEPGVPAPLQPADLRPLPTTLIGLLAHAAGESDPGMVEATLATISAGWPELGARLAPLAAEFQFELIESLARDAAAQAPL
jgi:CheY-like chemotaxis protein